MLYPIQYLFVLYPKKMNLSARLKSPGTLLPTNGLKQRLHLSSGHARTDGTISLPAWQIPADRPSGNTSLNRNALPPGDV